MLKIKIIEKLIGLIKDEYSLIIENEIIKIVPIENDYEDSVITINFLNQSYGFIENSYNDEKYYFRKYKDAIDYIKIEISTLELKNSIHDNIINNYDYIDAVKILEDIQTLVDEVILKY